MLGWERHLGRNALPLPPFKTAVAWLGLNFNFKNIKRRDGELEHRKTRNSFGYLGGLLEVAGQTSNQILTMKACSCNRLSIQFSIVLMK